MVPGGATEMIWHFAGYLHLAEEISRAEILYQSEASQPHPFEFQDTLPQFAPISPTDDLETFPIRVHYLPANDLFEPVNIIHSSGHAVPPLPARLAPFAPFHNSPHPFSSPVDAGGVIFAGQKLLVVYEHQSDQKFIDANQVNRLFDDDISLTKVTIASGALETTDVPDILNAMIKTAQTVTPADLVIENTHGQALVDFVIARDMHIAGADMTNGADGNKIQIHDPHGIYVDGVLQPEATQVQSLYPTPPDLPSLAEPASGVGEAVSTGNNAIYQGAAILDANEAQSSLVVLGDYFKTDAIIQTNVLTNNTEISYAGGTFEEVMSGHNNVSNTAAFFQQTLPVAYAGQASNSMNWHVDIVDGSITTSNQSAKRTCWLMTTLRLKLSTIRFRPYQLETMNRRIWLNSRIGAASTTTSSLLATITITT